MTSEAETRAGPGLLITFEGPEGSGKTTLIAGLTERLAAVGVEPLLIREPGGTALGERIRNILLDPASEAMCSETELLLMVASRAQLVRERIVPALAGGRIILCDRFADASVAYQGYGRDLGPGVVRDVNRVALGNVVPDLTLLCMLAPEEGQARLAHRATDRLDRESVDFHRKVHAGYRALAESGEKRFKLIDASESPAKVLAATLKHLRGLEHGLLKNL